MTSPRAPFRVTVVGGGFAAAEVLLALRALAADRVTLELIAPRTELPFRVASTGASFGKADLHVYDLAELAADVGASFRRDTAEAVAAEAHRVRLMSGAVATYDALVVAVGARARVGVQGATTFRDQRDSRLLARLVDELEDPSVRRIAFAAPTGVSWTLPLYELSLLTAAEISRRRLSTEVVLVTPERRALEVFGPAVSARIEIELERRGVRLLSGTAPIAVSRGRLKLGAGETLAADRVVAIPRLVGRRLGGVPADWNGFIHTDALGRVLELPDVFAAGDVTAFPVKQGGLAAQQADVIATTLAARAGATVARVPERYVLRSQLLGLDEPLYLRTELDGRGQQLPPADAPSVSEEPPWWPAAKLFGRHLTPWMAGHREHSLPR